jgi:pyruvate formate lyase activating enzyme
VRFRRGDELRVPFGYVARRFVRAVETNTIYHVRPGAKALTFGMYGCDLRCPYCQNWRVSQALRESRNEEQPQDITAAALVAEAVKDGCRVLCAAFNEPLIAAEWVAAVFAEARRAGLLTALVSDGHTTLEALRYLRPVTDVFRVDLKGARQEQYRELGGRLEPVLAGIAEAHRLGYWVEAVTLVVPGFNDDLGGLRSLARYLVAIDADLPWHLNAFQPRYQWEQRPVTSTGLLLSAAGMAYAQGLHFVYVSNVPDGSTTFLMHTRCPACGAEVVRRRDYAATPQTLIDGHCPHCKRLLAGLWN